jgi:hypothetical protein
VQTNRTVNGSLTFLAESAESAKLVLCRTPRRWLLSTPFLFYPTPINKYSNLINHNISTVPFTRYLLTYPDINVAETVVDNGVKVGVDNGVKVGIEGLEDGDGAAVRTVFLWDKGSTCAFDGYWEDSCCKDDGDELFKELRPFWVKTGEYVQCEAFVA